MSFELTEANTTSAMSFKITEPEPTESVLQPSETAREHHNRLARERMEAESIEHAEERKAKRRKTNSCANRQAFTENYN
ncbi:10873_t:CDS:2, partial [Racocetra persica]